VIVGTVNGSEYLRDVTGNRRFWPVRVGRIDLEAIIRDRDQLWAEARSLFEDGKTWWTDDVEASMFADEQSDRLHVDEWLSRIEEFARLKPFVTVGEVLSHELSIEPGKWTQGDQNRVARCLQQLGRVRTRERSTTRRWGYAVPSYTIQAEIIGAHGPVGPVAHAVTGTENVL
jgi:predicted P-loop ATPase